METPKIALKRAKDASSNLMKNWPLRRPTSSWAGGEMDLEIIVSKIPTVDSETTTAWSKNGKWSGNNAKFTIRATQSALRLFPGLIGPGELVIVDAKKIQHREYSVSWLEQGRGFQLKIVKGFLIRGHHVKSRTIQLARKKAKSDREKTLDQLLQSRRDKKFWSVENLKHIFVSSQDSIRAGNCESGTQQAISRLVKQFGNFCGLRADVLLDANKSNYTRRAIVAASNRVQDSGRTI